MIHLPLLRTGAYIAFLLSGTGFLVSSLLIGSKAEEGYGAFFHHMTLFSTLVALLLCISLSITLLARQDHEDRARIVLAVSLLISTMIAAGLFLL